MAVKTPLRPFTDASALNLPELVLELVGRSAIQGLNNPVTGAISRELLNGFATILSSARWPLVGDEEAAQAEWLKIAARRDVTEYMLQLTGTVMFSLHGWGLTESVVDWVANAYGGNRSAEGVIHPQLLSKLPAVADLQRLYTNNPWLLCIVLLNQSGKIGELIDGYTKLQAKG